MGGDRRGKHGADGGVVPYLGHARAASLSGWWNSSTTTTDDSASAAISRKPSVNEPRMFSTQPVMAGRQEARDGEGEIHDAERRRRALGHDVDVHRIVGGVGAHRGRDRHGDAGDGDGEVVGHGHGDDGDAATNWVPAIRYDRAMRSRPVLASNGPTSGRTATA